VGTLQPQDDLGSIPEGQEKLFFEAFSNLLMFYGNLFVAELWRRNTPER
jgi:hypothetical protein